MGARVPRSPLCPGAALTVDDLAGIKPTDVLLMFDYVPSAGEFCVNSCHRVRIQRVDHGRGQVYLTMVDLLSSSWRPMVSLGLMPDPNPNRNMPGWYLPGTTWHRRILVRLTDGDKPQPVAYL